MSRFPSIRIFQAVLTGMIVLVSIAGAANAIRLGLRDYRSHLPSISERRRAVESGICDAEDWLRLADLKQEAGELNVAELERAVECNPNDSEAQVLLGLANEARGNVNRARALFLSAALSDHGFVPRWTLANFFFRRGEADLFFQWMNQALVIASTDVLSAFPLYWRITDDKNRILSAIPRRSGILRQYLAWLIQTNRLEAAYAVSQVEPFPDLALARRELLSLCDRLIEGGDGDRAVSVWNMLSDRQLVKGGKLNPETGSSIANTAFSWFPLAVAFDWRPGKEEGFTITPSMPGIRISLSGNEPESCELLSQYIVLSRGKKYKLSYHYEASLSAQSTGVRWQLRDRLARRNLMAGAPTFQRNITASDEVSFVAPSDVRLARLVLMYQRELGETRTQGWINLTDVALGFAK
jgi:tetratricopeptide (TPR) repeat protein